MIFASLCIALLLSLGGIPSYAAAGADNSPGRVDDAVKRIASDRRFVYPEGSLDNPFDSKEFLDMLARFERLRRGNEAPAEPEAGADGPAGSLFGGWGFGDINFDVSILIYVFYGIGIVILSFVMFRLVLFYYPQLGRGGTGPNADGVEYLESLDPTGRVSLAQKMMREKRWAEALSALMMALILTLDSRQLIRYHRSKTSREYLQLLRGHPLLFTVAREFVAGFEEMKFGHRTPDEEGLYYMYDLFTQAEKALPAGSSELSTATV
jgi:hypothetical protein